MKSTELSWNANFIWGIADDVLRDLYVRGNSSQPEDDEDEDEGMES